MSVTIYADGMALFLVVYDRSRARTVEFLRFNESDRAEATRARNEREFREVGNPEIEVLVLEADTEDDLRRTHGRYFDLGEEIAKRRL